MKKLALFLFFSFTYTLQGMENVEEEINQKFMYVVCPAEYARKNWELFREGTLHVKEPKIHFGIYKVFQQDDPGFYRHRQKEMEEKGISNVVFKHRSLPQLSVDQVVQMIKDQKIINLLKEDLARSFELFKLIKINGLPIEEIQDIAVESGDKK